MILFALVWFWIGPAVNGTASLSDGSFHLAAPDEYLAYSANSRLAIGVMTAIVLFLCVMSTLKPWGIRKRDFAVPRKLIIIVIGVLVVGGTVNAMLTSRRLQTYRKMEIADTDLSAFKDGTYPGEATAGKSTYKVAVTVQNHTITGIQIVQNRTSSYSCYAEGVVPKVLKAQNANTDTVTGATTTSKALLKAIENALTLKQ